MRPSGSSAFGYARARAWKSRLLTRDEVLPLLALTDSERIRRSIEPPFAKLMRIYQRWPMPLTRAMLRLHEIENVKLLWRATARGKHADPRLWIPLGSLATVRNERAFTLRDLVDAVAKTPYAKIANDVLRASRDDIAAAELAFDRWASRQLLDEARKLPRRESLARQLIEAFVAKRDARQPLDLTRLCRRAFRGDPFTLAPVIALILLTEAEVRAVRGLIERQGDTALDAAFARAAAGSQLA
ncbi:MAG TPA: V-type ATPase subunit [Vicinamibacterales bacterium]|nr:V-type ATPase subunit [Thermoanaerobaculia bacterium]HUK34699.1 V-type ATPase subunit [Vicinamibacterales bacterium]